MNCHMMRILKKLAVKLNIKKIYYYIASPFCHRKVDMSEKTARAILEKFSACPSGNCNTVNQVVEPFLYDLQIIVPAYNVEKYLRECMDSILMQKTRYTYKVILIDDGSTDSTGQIADEYLNDERVQIIHQENKGFSGARNVGLKTIMAQYIMFVDSDDKLADNAIEVLMHTAIRNNAAIVEGNYCYLYKQKLEPVHRYSKVKWYRDAVGNLTGYPWGKVFKSIIFKNICFPKGFWYEDSILSFLVYPQIESVWVIPCEVYIYRQHDQNISCASKTNPKCVDTFWITEYLLKEYERCELLKNDAYYAKLMRQIILNEKRVEHMPIDIQHSIFILTGLLYDKYLQKICYEGSEYYKLVSAIVKKDFAKYCLYCKTH